MRTILIFLLISSSLTSFSQITQHAVAPVGEYKNINTANDIRIVKLLVDSNYDNNKLVDSIKLSPNTYIPPVLYVLSYVLFNQGKKDEACFWFYLAQLRARYDVNRCTDKTANASEYNMTFGPSINQYAIKEMGLDSLQALVNKVVDFEKNNQEAYDQRWINLTGMNAMSAGLGDKKEAANTQLSLPQEQWADIKKKTIADYMDGFNEAMVNFRKQGQSK